MINGYDQRKTFCLHMYFGFGNGYRSYTPLCSKNLRRCVAYRKDKTLDIRSLGRCPLNRNRTASKLRINIESLFKNDPFTEPVEIQDTRI